MEIFAVMDIEADAPDWVRQYEGRKIVNLVAATLGDADATCALISFEDDLFAVGVGNPLRPYEELYFGESVTEATRIWVRWCYPHLLEDLQ